MIRPTSFLFALTFLLLAGTRAMAQAPAYGPPPGYIPPGVTSGQNVVNYRVNRHGSRWNETQPIEAFLSQVTQRSWIRMEFMLWDIEDPGDEPIGAARGIVNSDEDGIDPILDGRTPFQFENGIDPGDSFGLSIIPNFDAVSLNDNVGIRGTYGIWFNGGEIEFSVFGSEQASDTISFPDLQANRNGVDEDAGQGTLQNPNVIIPLTTDGVLGQSSNLAFIGFDSSYTATLRSQFWGAELNVLSAPQASVNAMTWQWLGGIRYMNFDESFTQVGVSDGGGAFGPLTSRIRSSATNNSYGPTVGFRTKLDSKYVTLSVTPRVTFALNDYTNRLSTGGDGFDSLVAFEEEEIDFTTMTQVSFLAEVHPTEALTFFGGYDFFWSYRASRPFRGTNYDSTIGTNLAGDEAVLPVFGLNPDPETLSLQGFSFGATYRF